MKYSNASSLIERDQPFFISSFKEKKLSACTRDKKRERKKKKKKKGGIVRHMTQYNERCWSVLTNDKETVGERCAHVRISSNSAEALSRMQIVCQEDGKNPRAHRVIQGIFFGEFSHGGRSSGPNTRPFN